MSNGDCLAVRAAFVALVDYFRSSSRKASGEKSSSCWLQASDSPWGFPVRKSALNRQSVASSDPMGAAFVRALRSRTMAENTKVAPQATNRVVCFIPPLWLNDVKRRCILGEFAVKYSPRVSCSRATTIPPADRLRPGWTTRSSLHGAGRLL